MPHCMSMNPIWLIVEQASIRLRSGCTSFQNVPTTAVTSPALPSTWAVTGRATTPLGPSTAAVTFSVAAGVFSASAAADVSQDPKTGAPYYTARIALEDAEVAKLKGARLVPGMPAESFIQTSRRTVLSYLMKPATDQVARAFRER